jgi:8-oxo-dGTP diphosphatase
MPDDGPESAPSDAPLFGTPEPDQTYWWRPGVYGLVPNEMGELAVVQLDDGKWFLPGGGIEAGENDMATLEREVAEETGLVVTVGAKIWEANEYTWASTEKYFVKQARYYEAHLTGRTVSPIEDDHTLLWVSTGTAAERLYHESQRELVCRWTRR